MALSAADLAGMQATSQTTKTTASQILRVTRTSDNAGGFTDVWNTQSSPLCRLAPYQGEDYEEVIEGRLTLANRWWAYFAAGTDVQPKDRITVLGLTLEVATVQDPRTIEIERCVLCYEVA